MIFVNVYLGCFVGILSSMLIGNFTNETYYFLKNKLILKEK
jgi:hypothetical protein